MTDKMQIRSKLTMLNQRHKELVKRKRHSEAAALYNKDIVPLQRQLGGQS